MESKYGFLKMNAKEFEGYIADLKVARTVIKIQQHHTYIPSYSDFKGNNHFEMQKSMKNTHINKNGWANIGQHISIFPDGEIVTGRSFEDSPAGIYGSNADAFCIENVGYFDKGEDVMRNEQRDSIITVTTALCEKFGLTPNTDTIIYHHWFKLGTGERNNGAGGNKSCPGTNFFGGNKVEDCNKNFIPLIKIGKSNSSSKNVVKLQKYVMVTASSLIIRTGASTSFSRATGRASATFGSILRVFEEKNNWYRVSSSEQHWVYGNYTKDVQRAVVNANVLNVRSGAGTNFSKIGSLTKGTEVFVNNRKNGWSQISIDSSWISDNYIDFDNN